MKKYAVISTRTELKTALKNNVSQIIVTDPKLARNIKIVKTASKVAVATAIGSVGVAATNFWNPVGWGVGAVGIAAGGSTLIAIITLGIGTTLIYALHNGYNIKAKGKVTTPNGRTYDAEITLEKR